MSHQVKGKDKSITALADKIDENLAEIKKFLEVSEEVIKREATEHPKILTSITELNKYITELETKLNDLEIKQIAVEKKSKNMAIFCGVGGAVGGVIATIAIWKSLPIVKKW